MNQVSAQKKEHLSHLFMMIILSFGLSVGLSACSLHAMTGDMMTEYTVEHLAPYILQTDDLGMACEMGVSMGPYLLSFERVREAPHQAAVSTLVTAALCAEREVWREELRSIRAFKNKQIAEYKDARVAQKRSHRDAARRYYHAYQRMTRLYGEGCQEGLDELGELTMLLGLVAGVQSVQHDRASGVMVGVPTDTPRKVARQAECLNSERWWGAPKAIQAAVWLVVPNSIPNFKGSSEEVKKRAYDVFESQVKLGQKAGVRLVDSIYAYATYAIGDTKRTQEIISAHARSVSAQPPHSRWVLLDLTSTAQLQALSDKMWSEARGHRTPNGELGQFWEAEEKKKSDEEEDDSLLDDLDDEE